MSAIATEKGQDVSGVKVGVGHFDCFCVVDQPGVTSTNSRERVLAYRIGGEGLNPAKLGCSAAVCKCLAYLENWEFK